MEGKKREIEEAEKYCKKHICKGYKAIATLNLKYIKDPHTINQQLSGNVITGEEKKSQRILTTE